MISEEMQALVEKIEALEAQELPITAYQRGYFDRGAAFVVEDWAKYFLGTILALLFVGSALFAVWQFIHRAAQPDRIYQPQPMMCSTDTSGQTTCR